MATKYVIERTSLVPGHSWNGRDWLVMIRTDVSEFCTVAGGTKEAKAEVNAKSIVDALAAANGMAQAVEALRPRKKLLTFP